jgi:hypothetical protein
MGSSSRVYLSRHLLWVCGENLLWHLNAFKWVVL